MTEIGLTDHARQRMAERGVTEDDVLATMADPETSYPGGPGHPPGRRIAVRGDLLVVYVEEPRTVVTVVSEHELGRVA
jgi:hypothetical protein